MLRLRPRPGEAPPQHEPKELVLVRHGRSLAQEAGGRDRKTNPALMDCGLSREGERRYTKLTVGEKVRLSIDNIRSFDKKSAPRAAAPTTRPA